MWGTAGVPGYDAGPFVRSGYKWTARTTELHLDGECKHRPPQGETPGEGTRASVRQPPPPRTPPHHTPTKARLVPRRAQRGQHQRQRSKRAEGGEHERGRERATVSCNVSCIMQPTAHGTGHPESTRSPVSIARTVFDSQMSLPVPTNPVELSAFWRRARRLVDRVSDLVRHGPHTDAGF